MPDSVVDSVVDMPAACQLEYKLIRFYQSFLVYALQIASISFILDEAVRIGGGVGTARHDYHYD
jgi:hypothetical protein